MTDKSEDADCLVNVRALVMVRDDSTGGWIPMGGGGLSRVSIRKYSIPAESDQVKDEYVIIGKRISDESVVLSCIVKKDFQYNKVMPTFHHWKTGDNKCGLTFQTTADARAFDKGLRKAVRELLSDKRDDGRYPCKKPNAEMDDDEAITNIDLSVDGIDSRSASDSSLRASLPAVSQEQAAQMSHFFNPTSEPGSPTSFSQLSGVQEDPYPDTEGARLVHQDSTGSLNNPGTETAPENTAKPSRRDKKKHVRKQCRYCQEIYTEEGNRRGACEYAPDCMRTTIDEVACVRAARCMMYHCMSDEEGEFAQHPCECTSEEGSHWRWMGLSLLSIFVPCLCLYPPLRGCHWCCIRCGLCGGRHRSAS